MTTSTSLDRTVSRLVDRVLMPGFNGTSLPDWLARALDDGLGGVLFFAHNLPDLNTASALSDAIHAVNPSAVVASDEEGGDVTRLEAAAGSSVPGNAALGAVDDVELTGRVAEALGRLQRAVGIDLDLAPSADVNANPDNPVIGVRSFGADPDVVARHTAAFVTGLQAAGVAAAAKHFPGHGDTDVDSHLDLPVLDVGLETLRRRDLAPFEAAVKAGVQALLSAHIRLPSFGPEPATLNPAILRLAREELGFDGVIVTDALDMQAVSRSPGFGRAAVQAAVAGADLLCLGNPDGRDAQKEFEVARAALLDAVAAGELRVERLEEAAARIDRLGAWLRQGPAPVTAATAQSELAAIGVEAARRAVTSHGDVRLEAAPCIADLRQRANLASGRNAQHVQREIAAVFRDTVFADPAAPVDSADPVSVAAPILAAAQGRPLVVVVREPHRQASEAAVLEALRAARPDVIVVFTGWPHAIAALGNRVIVTYGAGRANARAVAERLSGAGAPGR